jgi:hypothetical protein
VRIFPPNPCLNGSPLRLRLDVQKSAHTDHELAKQARSQRAFDFFRLPAICGVAAGFVKPA